MSLPSGDSGYIEYDVDAAAPSAIGGGTVKCSLRFHYDSSSKDALEAVEGIIDQHMSDLFVALWEHSTGWNPGGEKRYVNKVKHSVPGNVWAPI